MAELNIRDDFAFPKPSFVQPCGDFDWGNSGMTLRDYFAAKAMARLINGPSAQNICDRDPRYDETNFAQVVATNAYEFADAMLKARQS